MSTTDPCRECESCLKTRPMVLFSKTKAGRHGKVCQGCRDAARAPVAKPFLVKRNRKAARSRKRYVAANVKHDCFS